MIAESNTVETPGCYKFAGSTAATELIEWLVGDECHDLDDASMTSGFGLRLREAGLPIDRLTLHFRTLHPEVLGHSVAWSPNEEVDIRFRKYGTETNPGYVDSPLHQVMETRKKIVIRLDGSIEPDWIRSDLFHGRGLVEFIVVPLRDADGRVSAATFSTTRQSGFNARDRDILERLVPALRNACELRSLRSVEQSLLDTYVGASTARRVLSGRIRRGQVETLETALLLCDLRGFTQLSNRLPSERVLEILNDYFDRVVPAIIDAGGEVIKFMGDAVLAFFHRERPSASCRAALQGAASILDGLALFTAPDAQLHAGIALHYGCVVYGNIGSGKRLDFTMIGPDVNMVSRIQAVCSRTGHPLLMSEQFTQFLDPGITMAAGRHELAGFAEAVELYTLSNSDPQRCSWGNFS